MIINLKSFNDGALGGNYICNGKASGELFFETVLRKYIDENLLDDGSLLEEIILDANDTFGVPHIFLRTVIELCIETYGIELVENNISFYYSENKCVEKHRSNDIKNIIEFYKSKEKGYKHPDNLKYCKRYNLDKNRKTYE